MHQMTCLSPGLSVLSYLLHLIPTDASFLKSLLMTLHQFCHRRPGPLQNLSDSNCCAWLGILWQSKHETCPSQLSHWHLMTSSNVYSADVSLTFLFNTLSFPESFTTICGALLRAVLFEWLQTGHISGLYSKTERINASYNLVFTDKLLFLLFHIFG